MWGWKDKVAWNAVLSANRVTTLLVGLEGLGCKDRPSGLVIEVITRWDELPVRIELGDNVPMGHPRMLVPKSWLIVESRTSAKHSADSCRGDECDTNHLPGCWHWCISSTSCVGSMCPMLASPEQAIEDEEANTERYRALPMRVPAVVGQRRDERGCYSHGERSRRQACNSTAGTSRSLFQPISVSIKS